MKNILTTIEEVQSIIEENKEAKDEMVKLFVRLVYHYEIYRNEFGAQKRQDCNKTCSKSLEFLCKLGFDLTYK